MIFNRSGAKRTKLTRWFLLFFILLFALTILNYPAYPKDIAGTNDNPLPPSGAFYPDTWKKDGLPFLYYREKEAVSSIWQTLEAEKGGTDFSDSPTGFIPLRRQSRYFRGKRVRLDGRLLQTVFHQAVNENSDGNSAKKADERGVDSGYYESWILLDDEERIPARLLTRTVPDGFLPDSESEDESVAPRYRRERVSAVGIYYRQTSYNAGDDFYNAPLVVAETFSLVSGDEPARSAKPRAAIPARYYRYAAALTLVLLWILIRSGIKRRRKNEAASEKIMKDFVREPDDFRFPE